MLALRSLGSGSGFIPSLGLGKACQCRILPILIRPSPLLLKPTWLAAGANEAKQESTACQALWWEEGDGVRSLEIRCRDAKGDELDPWYLSELLMDVGAMSVSVDDSDRGTEDESPLLDDHGISKAAFDPSVPLPSALVSGRKDMWGGSSRLVALFPVKWDLAGVVATVEEVLELASPLAFKVDDVVDRDWVKTVQEGWDPIEVGDCGFDFRGIQLCLPPNLSRARCCKWLEDNVDGQRVLDYGSGSGILGLASLSFGAVEAVGVELDLSAIASAAVNAKNNGLKMDTYYPQEVGSGEDIDLVLTKLAVSADATDNVAVDAMEPLSVADGRAISTEELGKFDVTVANILAAPIIRLQPILTCCTRPGGKLALSGVLEEQADAVLAAYADSFELQVTERSGGWVLLSGVRYDTYSNRSEQEQDKNKKGSHRSRVDKQ